VLVLAVGIAVVDTAVTRPLPFTVMVGTVVELPNAPVFELTVASVSAALTATLPSNETVHDASPVAVIERAVASVVAVVALPVSAPVKLVEATEVNPASVVELAPSAIAVVPTVTELFTNLLLAILPANIVLVTVLVSPVVTTVPVVAGSVNTVPVPAIAAGTICTLPEVAPGSVTLKMPVSAKFALPRFRATDVVPIKWVSARLAIVESAAIVTAELPLKLVPLKPSPIVSALVVFPAIIMLAEPSKLTPLIVRAVCSVVAVVAFPDSAPKTVVTFKSLFRFQRSFALV
jgi:hypothetical protein